MYDPPPGAAPPPPAWPPQPGDAHAYGSPFGHVEPYQPPRRRSVVNRVAGPFVAAGALLLKYGVLLLKLGKIGPTLISMVISLVLLSGLFGWQFGAGILVLIGVHETGHLLAARAMGLPTGLPIFLGPLGAFVNVRHFGDRRQEAITAVAGPFVGSLASLLCYLYASSAPAGHLQSLAYALAYFGFFINLFNLVPFSPLDGGRVAGAVTKWANVAGLGILAALFLGFLGTRITPNPVLLIILILGAVSLVERFRAERAGRGMPPLDPRTRAWIGAVYFGMLGFAAVGMSVAHAALLDRAVIR